MIFLWAGREQRGRGWGVARLERTSVREQALATAAAAPRSVDDNIRSLRSRAARCRRRRMPKQNARSATTPMRPGSASRRTVRLQRRGPRASLQLELSHLLEDGVAPNLEPAPRAAKMCTKARHNQASRTYDRGEVISSFGRHVRLPTSGSTARRVASLAATAR